jgi:hypothetical protein
VEGEPMTGPDIATLKYWRDSALLASTANGG